MDTKVELKRALTKESTRNKLIDEKFRKMFLYGLKKSLTQGKVSSLRCLCLDDIVEYFSKYGAIDECKIYFETLNKKGSYKGFGFVLFSGKDTMQKILD